MIDGARTRNLRAVGPLHYQQARILPHSVAGRQVLIPFHATLDRARLGGDAAGPPRCTIGHPSRLSSQNNLSAHSDE